MEFFKILLFLSLAASGPAGACDENRLIELCKGAGSQDSCSVEGFFCGKNADYFVVLDNDQNSRILYRRLHSAQAQPERLVRLSKSDYSNTRIFPLARRRSDAVLVIEDHYLETYDEEPVYAWTFVSPTWNVIGVIESLAQPTVLKSRKGWVVRVSQSVDHKIRTKMYCVTTDRIDVDAIRCY